MKLNVATLAAATGTLIASEFASGAYTGIQVTLHTTIQTGGGPREVYRVYALFSEPGDVLVGWGGVTGHSLNIQALACTSTPGGNFFNPGGTQGNTAPTLEQINGSKKSPAIPNIQWGTFGTVGVSIADQGSGPTDDFPTVDQTILTPGFPTFISGNQLVSSTAFILAVPQDGEVSQGRADYQGDGDPSLRVLMMQLALPAGDHPQFNIGQITWRIEGSEINQTVLDQNNMILDAVGRCCAPSGDCFSSSLAGCMQFGNNIWLGCDPCTECQAHCLGDVLPTEVGDGVVNVDDLLHVIVEWGPGFSTADIVEPIFAVNVDDLLQVINDWGPCR